MTYNRVRVEDEGVCVKLTDITDMISVVRMANYYPRRIPPVVDSNENYIHI